MSEATEWAPSFRDRLRWKLRELKTGAVRFVDSIARKLNYVRMESDCNYVSHAQREFKAAGWNLEGDEMQKLMCEQVCELLRVFSTHGHSGSSAPYARDLFTKLSAFEPIVPLTGEDWEWVDHGNGHFQNNRCSRVFKQPDRFNGQAYDMDAIIWRDPDGCCFTNGDSHVPVTFPYTPTREYRDRPSPDQAA